MINRDSIVAYLQELNPQTAPEVAKTSSEVKAILQSLLQLIDRLNSTRQVPLLQAETLRLKTETGQLEMAIKEANALNKEHQEYSRQKETLLAEQATISDLERQKTELQQLHSFVNGHDIPGMKEELQQLKRNMSGNIACINDLLKEAEAFLPKLQDHFFGETRQLLLTVSKMREEINADLVNAQTSLEKEQLVLSGLLQDYDRRLSEAHSRYNAAVDQLTAIKTKLLELKNNHDKNVSIYETHFSQNKNIYGELGKPHAIDHYLQNLFGEIEEKLRQFDREIKKLVENADKISIS